MTDALNALDEHAIGTYLARIGYAGPRTADADTLHALHVAHRRTVPYENLDVWLQRPIEHTARAIHRKVVEGRRGGWCHELNGLFSALLESLGFRITWHPAIVHHGAADPSPDFSHLVLVAHLEERWIVDVGFGARGMTGPLRLDLLDQPQEDYGTHYLVTADPDTAARRLVCGTTPDGFAPLYSMHMTPHAPESFQPRREAQRIEPSWTGRRMVSLNTPDGRISVDGMKIVHTRNGVRSEREYPDEPSWRAAIRETFGIDLDR